MVQVVTTFRDEPIEVGEDEAKYLKDQGLLRDKPAEQPEAKAAAKPEVKDAAAK
jgi:hypothetical protein